jgi:RNA polymerase sigma-70 factor (ECF subfamily)
MGSSHFPTPDLRGGLPFNPLAKSNRNAPSFPDVYDAYLLFARRTLRRLGVRDADLMDMTQNVFLVVHRKLPRFEGRSKLTTWLYGICRRIATD